MQIIRTKLEDISNLRQLSINIPLDNEITIMCVFKNFWRSDVVLLDLYLNEISEDTKIVSSKLLKSNSIICLPRPDIGFNYFVECRNDECIKETINSNNLYKFYLYFTDNTDGNTWDIPELGE